MVELSRRKARLRLQTRPRSIVTIGSENLKPSLKNHRLRFCGKPTGSPQPSSNQDTARASCFHVSRI